MTGPRLSNRVALVTGGASGMGAATVSRLLAEGASVLIGDANLDRIGALQEHHAHRVAAIRCDVRSPTSMRDAVDAAVTRWGRLDIGINAAGVGASGLIADMSLDEFSKVIDVNLLGVFASMQAEAAHFLAAGEPGVIVNFSSTNAVQPGEGLAAYAASKAAVSMLTKVAALELGGHGIRVVAVGPGLTETPMVSRFLENERARTAFTDGIPLGHPAKPEDIAALVSFLCSDDASYVTGDTIFADGGALTKAYPSLAERGLPRHSGADNKDKDPTG